MKHRGLRGAAIQSQCGGKKRYRQWEQASHVRKIRMREGVDELRIYDCPICNGFHLTKQRLKETG